MRMSALFPLMICAMSLSACQTGAPSAGAGYELLTPSVDTARTIVATDRPFAEQVAAHNRQCRADAACRK